MPDTDDHWPSDVQVRWAKLAKQATAAAVDANVVVLEFEIMGAAIRDDPAMLTVALKSAVSDCMNESGEMEDVGLERLTELVRDEPDEPDTVQAMIDNAISDAKMRVCYDFPPFGPMIRRQ
jgi:hypothetical protein